MQDTPLQFDTKQECVYQDELHGLEGRPLNPLAGHRLFNLSDSSASTSGRTEAHAGGVHYGPQWGLLNLSQPVTASEVNQAYMTCHPGGQLHVHNTLRQ